MVEKQGKQSIPQYCIDLGSKIRELRKYNKISIEEIAYKVGIDAQNLRKYELGKQEMRVSMLKRIADAFEISLSALFKGFEDYSFKKEE